MEQSEVISLLQKYLPPELLPQVFDTLHLPPMRKPGEFLPDLSHHVEVAIPFHFEVEADSQAEAIEMVKMAIAEKGIAFYGSCGGELEGRIDGELTVTNLFCLPPMTEGDDPFEYLHDL